MSILGALSVKTTAVFSLVDARLLPLRLTGPWA